MQVDIDMLISEKEFYETEFKSLAVHLQDDEDEEWPPLPEYEKCQALLRMSILDKNIKFLDSCIMSYLDDVIAPLLKTA